jgi:hypothetical protein
MQVPRAGDGEAKEEGITAPGRVMVLGVKDLHRHGGGMGRGEGVDAGQK